MKRLEGMRLLLTCPTYGPADPLCMAQLRTALMHTAANGVEWAGDISPDKFGFNHARNTVAQELMDSPKDFANGVMWVDSDMRQVPEAMTALLDSAVQYGEKFVTGLYFQRRPPHAPVFYRRNKNGKYNAVLDYLPNTFAPTDACGFGFVYTHRSVIEAIAKSKGFHPLRGWFPDDRDTGGFGEDISFCDLAYKAGVQLHINTGVVLRHVGEPEEFGPEHYQKPDKEVEVTGPRVEWGIK